MPDSPDANNAAWRPNGEYVLCNGDKGCQWKWTDAGGEHGTWTKVEGLVIPGSAETAWHPGGSYAIVGCAAGKVYKFTHATGVYTEIRNKGDSTSAGICWHPQGHYAILAGSMQFDPPYGQHVLVFDHADQKFYEVDTHPDDKPFRKIAWQPSGAFAVGAINNFYS